MQILVVSGSETRSREPGLASVSCARRVEMEELVVEARMDSRDSRSAWQDWSSERKEVIACRLRGGFVASIRGVDW